jgi:hypothetical protein
MNCQMKTLLGVYVLGAADARERARVEAHLPGCRKCRAELTRLRPLPGLLASVPDDMLAAARPPGRPARQPLRARSGGRAGRSWRAAAIAACVAAAAGAAGGFWLAPSDAGQPAATVTLAAVNPATHVAATAALTATSWGTSIQLRLSGIPLDVPCRLIVRSRQGATEVSGVWDAWSAGPISVPASAAWLPSDIASLQIATASQALVTISADHSPAATGLFHIRAKAMAPQRGGHNQITPASPPQRQVSLPAFADAMPQIRGMTANDRTRIQLKGMNAASASCVLLLNAG